MIRALVVFAALAGGLVAASAVERHRSRGPLVQQHRPVGRAVPIVAGSSTIKVDAVGQVLTDFYPGQLNDGGRATGGSN